MRGILLIWQKMRINIQNGYIPSWWTQENRRDVDYALRYLGDLYDWYEARHKKDDTHDGGEGE